MATREKTKSTTPRQIAYDEAAAAEGQARQEMEELGNRLGMLTADLAEKREERDARERQIEARLRALPDANTPEPELDRLRAERTRLEEAIAHTAELHQEAHNRYHTEVFGRHQEARQVLTTAEQNLRREPCDEALTELDRMFRAIEAQWVLCGQLARDLEQHGDVWARQELIRMQYALGHSTVASRGYDAVVLPHFPQ